MATGKSSKGSLIRIDLNGEKHRIELSHSSTASELRALLSERYKISSNTYFLDSEDCRLYIEDEESVTIDELLTEKNFVRLKTDDSKPTSPVIPEKKSDELRRTPSHKLKIPESTLKPSDSKIILATDLNLDMWEKIYRNCNLFGGIQMDGETPRRAFKPIFQFRQLGEHYPLYQITDNSNIRAYMKDKELQSSFLSSNFFDGGINFSSPFIGIGIHGEYLKTKTTINTQRKTYLTYCFNFPRVKLELDLSYLEPTSEFIEDIDSVLSLATIDEQILKLEKVLSIYGHVYPRFVLLGGHLYHTEVHDNEEKAEEAKKRLSANVSFSASLIQPGKIQMTGGLEKQSKEKSSEQTSLLTFEAVGGDTRLNRDPTRWANTIVDPSLWRIIEQDHYQSVITLLDKQRQDNLQEIFSYYLQKRMVTKMTQKWKAVGITVAGGNGWGNRCNQLAYPCGICIDDDQTIYIADYLNHRIVEWRANAKSGRIVAGGNGRCNQLSQLNLPTDVLIDKENHSLIIADYGNKRIMRWSRDNNTCGKIILSDINCFGLAMDKYGRLYVSDSKKNEVRRLEKENEYGVIVAGGNGKGSQLNQLNFPGYIFVDEHCSLYIADRDNHRVMKWLPDSKQGVVVAGGFGQGNRLSQLSKPQGITVDQLGHVYIADCDNNRVVCWCKDDDDDQAGRIVIEENQFDKLRDVTFDRQGNLYVVDHRNHRIQKFEIDLD